MSTELSRRFALQSSPRRSWWERVRPVLRGCWAVVVLVATAVDALITAVLGVAPLTPRLRTLRQVLADEYRAGRAGAVDAEVFDPNEQVGQEVMR